MDMTSLHVDLDINLTYSVKMRFGDDRMYIIKPPVAYCLIY